MTLATFALACWAFSAVAMAAVWAVSMRARNVGYVDVAWAGLMAIVALFAGAFAMGSEVPRALVALFGSVWGARLSLHLLARVLHEPEDGRYQALRARWNGSPARFFVFFQMQALVVALFSVPFFAAASQPEQAPLRLLAAAGVWLAGLGGEALADRQLARFRADPAHRGQTCRTGLWGWSRHPNYFFEWIHWFAYVILAAGGPLAAWSWLGPAVMLLFLYRVSGIPWTEAQALRSRGDDYRRYQAEVSAFLPLPPRRGPSPRN
jgi:steroid 5-alpha reductase family enzyme